MENLLEAVSDCAKAIDEKFGQDIKILDVSKLSALCDYFIIATAGNPNQARAIYHAAEDALKKHGIKLLHSEGVNDTGWALLDFGVIILHLFDKEQREFYDLERLWSDAEEQVIGNK
jgi:ribosome-associated protein